MRLTAFALIMVILMSLPIAAGADLEVLDKPLWIFPGQQFRVCLRQPEGSGPLKCEHPDTVEMFDTWDQDDIQRYYFRGLRAGDATLHFSGKGGEMTMELEVLAWSDVYKPRRYEDIQLPRIWPIDNPVYDHLKTRRTLHSEAELEAFREAGRVSSRAQRWAETPDEEIYTIIPGPSVPRTCLIVMGSQEGGAIGKGCPVCGEEIYEGRSGFYPWIFGDLNGEHAWKVQCPNCKTWFPSNDWQEGDMHSGSFPDDGYGCEPVEPVTDENGRPWRFPFIAYYHQWECYMNELTPGIIETARAYAATEDEQYAHKCAIGLLRYSEAMLDLSINLNHRKMANRNGVYKWPVGAPVKSMFDRLNHSFMYIQPNWGTPRMENCAKAWDIIFNQLEGDQELIQFAQSHNHQDIKTIEDFRHFIDAGVLRVTAQAAIDNAVWRNYPQQETMAATMALGLATEQSLDIVDYLLNEVGIRFALSNQYFKDGAGHESPSYNHIQIRDMAELFQTFDTIRGLHPDLYQPPRYVSPIKDPKFRLQYDFPLDFTLIGRTFPVVGDCGKGGPPTPMPPRQGYPCDLNDWKIAYRQTGDERFAQCLYGPNGENLAKLEDPELIEAARRAGENLGWQVDVPSNILDGYGHAILRSGEGPHQRALWVRYKRTLQHAHSDMLTYGLAANKRSYLPELGYPEGWTFSGYWEKNWGTHYGTKISGLRTTNFNSGRLLTFADSKPAQVAVAESRTPFGDSEAVRQRLIALVDVSETEFYVVTCERVKGGEEHTWTFHGPDGEAEPIGIDPQPYEGTVLGEGIEYKDVDAAEESEMACLALMYDPARAEPEGIWALDYSLRDQEGMRMRMTSLYPDGGDVRIAKGKTPAGRSRYNITWAVSHHQGEAPLTKQYLQVIEPYNQERFIRSIERVPVEGADPDAEFAPLALRVTGDGFVDTIILQPEAAAKVRAGELTFDGEFGLWRERKTKVDTAVLVRGTELSDSDVAFTTDAAEYRGTIRECDWAEGSIVVEPHPGSVEALEGCHVSLTNEAGSHAAYQVESVEAAEGGCRLTFDLDPRIGEGFVGECSDNTVHSETNLRMYPYGHYNGKTIASEDGSIHYRLRGCENGHDCLIDTEQEGEVSAGTLQKQFGDYDGDGLSRLVIYDYGPGDTVIAEQFSSIRVVQ